MAITREPYCLLNTKEAARFLGLSPAMLERLRWLGSGPAYLRPTGERAIRYRFKDLVDWTEAHRVVPGTEAGR